VPIPAACPSLQAYLDYMQHIAEDVRPKVK